MTLRGRETWNVTCPVIDGQVSMATHGRVSPVALLLSFWLKSLHHHCLFATHLPFFLLVCPSLSLSLLSFLFSPPLSLPFLFSSFHFILLFCSCSAGKQSERGATPGLRLSGPRTSTKHAVIAILHTALTLRQKGTFQSLKCLPCREGLPDGHCEAAGHCGTGILGGGETSTEGMYSRGSTNELLSKCDTEL